MSRSGVARAALWLSILVACLAGVSACGIVTGPPPSAAGGRPLPRPARVAVLVLENRSYGQVPRILHALGSDGILYLTWDEGAFRDLRGVNGPGGWKPWATPEPA